MRYFSGLLALSVTFLSPFWFLLIPLLAVLGWWRPSLGLFHPWRMAALLLLVLALSQPVSKMGRAPMDLWLLADLSASGGGQIEGSLPEKIELLQRARPSGQDRLRIVHYAKESLEVAAQSQDASLGKEERLLTRSALAIRTALASAQSREGEQRRPTRLLLLTDGYSTEPLAGLEASLKQARVPLDYLLVPPPRATDVRVESIQSPNRVQAGEPFLVETELRGNMDGDLPVVLYRNGAEVARRTVQLRNGSAKLEFVDRLGEARSFLYEAVVEADANADAYAGNNRAESYTTVAGGKRVLILSKYTPDPLADALRGAGFEVEMPLFEQWRLLNAASLSGVSAVVFNNVPSWELPSPFLNALEFFVHSQGGGLMMAGGQQSFAAGGYATSPLDKLLPVSMEQREEHRKQRIAMGIAMDRSGSMSASVAGGTKMDLANSGAASALENLSSADSITVFAVDSEAHRFVPLQLAAKNRSQIERSIRKIRSEGGGIYVYNGLKATWDELKRASQGQKHIILFSDAADSEQPEGVDELIKEMRTQGATVSVIALGTEGDIDADFLKRIAKLGDGRIFFVEDASELPNVFSQETIAVARSLFVREATKTQATGAWREISPTSPQWLSAVDGYNLSYLRGWASQALISQDEYQAPLLAFGLRGTGRSVALGMPLGAEYAQSMLNWPEYENFLQTLTRWLMGAELPRGIGLRSRIEGSVLQVDLLYDEAKWAQRLAETPPQLTVAIGGDQSVQQSLTWERITPGRFVATLELPQGELVRGAVTLGKQSLPFGPLVATSGAEWRFEPERIKELRQLSSTTGGSERLDLSEAWERPFHEPARALQIPLLVLALLVILAEALATRFGAQTPLFGEGVTTSSSKGKKRKAAKAKQSGKQEQVLASRTIKTAQKPQSKQTAAKTATSSRFARAKRGRK